MAITAPRTAQARDFLHHIGAKQVNVYVRTGRQPRLTFKFKGKSFGYDITSDDLETGASIVPELRALIANIDTTYTAKGVRAVRDISTGGARLKYAREEATLTRPKLAEQAQVPSDFIKWIEVNALPLKPHFTDKQIIAIARVCNVDPNWLADEVLIEPAAAEPPQQPVPPVAAMPPLPDELAARPPGMDYAAIGERLKAARTRIGWSQKDLGDKLYYTSTVVSGSEKGRRTGLFHELEKVAKFLRCNLHWLETGEGTIDAGVKGAGIKIHVPEPAAQAVKTVKPTVKTKEATPDLVERNVVSALEQRIGRLETLIRLQHEAIVANQALAQKYLKVLHRHSVEQRAALAPPAKPQKNPNRVAAMKAAWKRRQRTALDSDANNAANDAAAFPDGGIELAETPAEIREKVETDVV